VIPDPVPAPTLTTLVIYLAGLTLIAVIVTVLAVAGFREVLGYSPDSDEEGESFPAAGTIARTMPLSSATADHHRHRVANLRL